jgi:hypothetical protein
MNVKFIPLDYLLINFYILWYNDGMIYNNIVCIHDIIISLNNRNNKIRRRI